MFLYIVSIFYILKYVLNGEIVIKQRFLVIIYVFGIFECKWVFVFIKDFLSKIKF